MSKNEKELKTDEEIPALNSLKMLLSQVHFIRKA